MKKIIVLFLISFSFIAQSEEKKEVKQEELKEEKKTKVGLREQSKEQRVKPWDYHGLFLNLYGGLNVGSFDQGYDANGTNGLGSTFSTSNSTATGSLVGLGGGAQAGWMSKGLFIGGDLRLDYGTYELILFDQTISTESYIAIGYNLGLVVGYEFNFGVKLYGGFSPVSSLSLSPSAGTSSTYTGSSTKFGLSYLFDRGFGLGLEVKNTTYDERDGNKFPYTSVVTSGAGSFTLNERDLEVSEVLLYGHFPIQLARK